MMPAWYFFKTGIHSLETRERKRGTSHEIWARTGLLSEKAHTGHTPENYKEEKLKILETIKIQALHS